MSSATKLPFTDRIPTVTDTFAGTTSFAPDSRRTSVFAENGEATDVAISNFAPEATLTACTFGKDAAPTRRILPRFTVMSPCVLLARLVKVSVYSSLGSHTMETLSCIRQEVTASAVAFIVSVTGLAFPATEVLDESVDFTQPMSRVVSAPYFAMAAAL